MIKAIINRIEVYDDHIHAEIGDQENELWHQNIEILYNENSAIALAIDLLSRLILTFAAQKHRGYFTSANNGEDIYL